MDRRLALEKLLFKELQIEVRKYGLKPTHSRDRCIDLLINLFESSNHDSSAGLQVTPFPNTIPGLMVPQKTTSSSHQVTSVSVPNMNFPEHHIVQPEETPCIPVSQAFSFSNETPKSIQSEPISHLCTLLTEQQQQQMMQLLTSLVTSRSTLQDQVSSPPLTSHHSNTNGSDHVTSTKISVNTVNLLASQLPEFSGKEDDDIELWI